MDKVLNRRGVATSRVALRWLRGTLVLACLGLLVSCAAKKVAPGSSEYRTNSYHSVVTVTGNDVPGVLQVREASAWLGSGQARLTVQAGESVTATYSAWVNGHGRLIGTWLVDDAEVDRVALYITYGETLLITLKGAQWLPTHKEGTHTVRFVVESPVVETQVPEMTYKVVGR